MAVTKYGDIDEYEEPLNVVFGPDEVRLVEGVRSEVREKYGDEYRLMGEEIADEEEFEYEAELPESSALEEIAAHFVAGSITSSFMVLEAGAQATFSTMKGIAKALD
jgi:hypothetical protein